MSPVVINNLPTRPARGRLASAAPPWQFAATVQQNRCRIETGMFALLTRGLNVPHYAFPVKPRFVQYFQRLSRVKIN